MGASRPHRRLGAVASHFCALLCIASFAGWRAHLLSTSAWQTFSVQCLLRRVVGDAGFPFSRAIVFRVVRSAPEVGRIRFPLLRANAYVCRELRRMAGAFAFHFRMANV